MWRGLQLALAAVLLAASPATASTGSISDVVPVTDGIFTATFRASSDECEGGGGCVWTVFATTHGAATPAIRRARVSTPARRTRRREPRRLRAPLSTPTLRGRSGSASTWAAAT